MTPRSAAATNAARNESPGCPGVKMKTSNRTDDTAAPINPNIRGKATVPEASHSAGLSGDGKGTHIT